MSATLISRNESAHISLYRSLQKQQLNLQRLYEAKEFELSKHQARKTRESDWEAKLASSALKSNLLKELIGNMETNKKKERIETRTKKEDSLLKSKTERLIGIRLAQNDEELTKLRIQKKTLEEEKKKEKALRNLEKIKVRNAKIELLKAQKQLMLHAPKNIN
jgi:hypothetical protein